MVIIAGLRNIGIILEIFSLSGTKPEASDWLIIWVIGIAISSRDDSAAVV